MELAGHLPTTCSGDPSGHANKLWNSRVEAKVTDIPATAERRNDDAAKACRNQLIESAISVKSFQSIFELDRTFGPAFRGLGFDYFHAMQINRSGDEMSIFANGGKRHLNWESHYNLRNYSIFDPIISEMMRSHEACYWSELPGKRGRLTPAERLVLDDAAKFGLIEGYVLPVHSEGAKIAAVVLAGKDIDPNCQETRSATATLSSAYLGKVKLLRARPAAQGRTRLALKSRQTECLKWVAAGKTSAEIAIVLGLSRKTVDEHVENACKSFGVNGRVQAVVRAIHLGLIPQS